MIFPSFTINPSSNSIDRSFLFFRPLIHPPTSKGESQLPFRQPPYTDIFNKNSYKIKSFMEIFLYIYLAITTKNIALSMATIRCYSGTISTHKWKGCIATICWWKIRGYGNQYDGNKKYKTIWLNQYLSHFSFVINIDAIKHKYVCDRCKMFKTRDELTKHLDSDKRKTPCNVNLIVPIQRAYNH